ncbi:MAG TPA: hypothetical protein VNM48_06035 [Chloroflexota bacterium]|nr:hypothetical protein [Chloroflexota bacterium]
MGMDVANGSQWVLQAGAAGALLFLLGAIRAGWLATRQEVDAWKARTERAEKQVDTLLPAIETLTKAMSATKGAA